MRFHQNIFFPLFNKRNLGLLLFTLFVLFVVYSFPRFLVARYGIEHPWLSYFYTYGLGILFYVSSVLFILTRKIHSRRLKQVKTFVLILTIMLAWGMIFHGLWIFMALQFPFKGLS